MSVRTLLGGLPTWRPEDPHDGPSEAPAPLGLLVLAAGVFLVCTAYGLGRQGRPGAAAAYWTGELLVVAPVVLGVMSARTGQQHRVRLLVALGAIQSFLAWAYSPLRFTFPDELQHLRTAEDILRTGHLFTPNSYLPVSPGFPGLELVTTCLVSLTGLSTTVCGVLVVSIAHVVLVAAVVQLYELVLGGGRTAAVAGLVYAANPHSAYFNTKFVYVALALPFLVHALRLGLSPGWSQSRRALALLPLAVATVTHHLTMLAAALLLIALAAAQLALAARADARARHDAGVQLLLGLQGLVMGVAWTAVAAPSTFDYLTRPIAALARAVTGRGEASSRGGALVAVPPMAETLVSAACVLATLGLVVAGLVLLRRRSAPALPRAFSLLALGYVGVLGVRVVASDGAELAARSLTYVMLLVAVPAAVALSWVSRRERRVPRLTATALVVLLFAGAITVGLPPFWERLPGKYRIGGFESGQDLSTYAAGQWASEHLPRDTRVAADLDLGAVLASYANADLSTAASPLFYDGTVAGVGRTLARLSLAAVFVDRRLTTQLPITGAYFPNDSQSGQHTSPLSPALLAPFDEDPLIDRVYDNGHVQAYLTKRAWTS